MFWDTGRLSIILQLFVDIYEYFFFKNATWDISILITGRDLYLPTSYNTNDYFVRGLASIGEVCSTNRNCIIVEGSQIHAVPILMTHELGHAMGLTHDDIIEQNDTVFSLISLISLF